jgi:tetratricopeptide (TPR) repeat protein
MPIASDPLACPHCGTVADCLQRTVLIDEHDILGLLLLSSKDFDTTECRVCHRKRSGHPSVELCLHATRRRLRLPGLIEGTPLATTADPEGQCSDLAAFRATARGALERNASPLRALPDPLPGLDSIETNWRLLTAAAFAAEAVLRVLLSENAKLEPIASSIEALPGLGQDLGGLQGEVWARLATEAATLVRSGHRLVDEIARFIQPEAVLPGAIDRMQAILSGALPRLAPDRLAIYCMLAVGAWAHYAGRLRNPFAAQWVSAWFAHETNEFGQRPQDAALKARARIDDDVAKRLLPVAEVARFVREAQRSIDPRRPDAEKEAERRAEIMVEALRPIGQEGLVEATAMADPRKISRHERRALAKLMRKSAGGVAPLDGPAAVARTLRDCRSLLRTAKAIKDPIARAKAEERAGSACNRLEAPREFLEAVGDEARACERNLPDEVRFGLWLERSNALRAIGRVDDALAVLRELEPVAATVSRPDATRVLGRNMALLLRDTGAPDEAMRRLERLVGDCPDVERPKFLESLAITYQVVGRHRDAAEMFAKARDVGILAEADRSYLIAAEALAHANADDVERALTLLEALPRISSDNVRATLMEIGAWAVILDRDRAIGPRYDHRLKSLVGAVSVVATEARDCGLHRRAEQAFQALTYFCNVLGAHTRASATATAAKREAAAQGAHADPIMSLVIATEAFRAGEREAARAELEAVPCALGARYGAVVDQEAALGGLRDLRRWFEHLARAALEGGGSSVDLRVIMELRREAFRLARPPRAAGGGRQRLDSVLDDKALLQLSPEHGRVMVLEWLDLGGAGCQPRLTAIQKGGAIDVSDLARPSVAPREVGSQILNVLENSVGRGDPFAKEAWQRMEGWALDVVAPKIETGDHLIFIEDHSSGHVPWHVAIGRLAPVSYAHSWSMLLRSEGASTPRREGGVGALIVPKRKDGALIVHPFAVACGALKEVAEAAGLQFRSFEGVAGDRQAALEIVGTSYFAALLCHGFNQPSANDVALLVAEDGLLPTAWHGQDEAEGRHRLSWRHIASAERIIAPVIASMACSSGAGYFAGLGERLGLFREFNRAGSRALVAPRWKSHAPATGPILVDIAWRHLVDGAGLGRAVREACLAAEQRGVQRRHAWNLALEGEWR